jgi:DNA-damage-inducible protein D
MESQELLAFRGKLDERKMVTEGGVDYWRGRDLQSVLGYDTWQNFDQAIERAMRACESVGVDPAYHFSDATKLVTTGDGAQMPKADVFLTRYACYLIAMNGDSRKPEIGFAQSYFAIQTRRQEKFDELTEAEKRIELRQRVTDNVKHLNDAAKGAGVQDYPSFHAAGYRGLYGGLGVGDIKQKKDIGAKESILDRAGRAELAANDFRITQTEAKLAGVESETHATAIHHSVGKEVRKAIENIGGTMPEDLPPEPHIKHLLKEQKKRKKQLLKDKN